jgi:hypothetical protein
MWSSSSYLSKKSSRVQFSFFDFKIWAREVEGSSRFINIAWKYYWLLFYFLRNFWPISALNNYPIVFIIGIHFQWGKCYAILTPKYQVMASGMTRLNNRRLNLWGNLGPWLNFDFLLKHFDFFFKILSHMHGILIIFGVYIEVCNVHLARNKEE